MITDDIKKVLVTAEEIEELCTRLGKKINEDYEGRDPLIIGLLKGCQPFMADLMKHIDGYVKVDYMKVSSYHGTTSGTLAITKDVDVNVKGEDIIVVDDIVDTGKTIKAVADLLKGRGAKSVEFCCLLDKPENRCCDVHVKYPGAQIPSEFVVGYGLDYNELYRNLPYIGALKESVYRK